MKNITVCVAETGVYHDLTIAPGTTARDIITQVGLADQYLLSRGHNREPFGADENVYESVADGAKLFASSPVTVGMHWLPAGKVRGCPREAFQWQTC